MDTTDKVLEIPAVEGLEFDDATHTYRIDGLVIPSVSAILGPLSKAKYAGISERTLGRAADKGTAVHNSIENWIKFEIEDIPPEHIGYFNAFRAWWDEFQPEVVGSEVRICHRLMRYGGTADLVAYISDELTLVDYKSTYVISDMTCGVQLEAYLTSISSVHWHRLSHFFWRPIPNALLPSGGYGLFKQYRVGENPPVSPRGPVAKRSFPGRIQTDDASIDRFITEMKAAGRQKEIQKELKRLKATVRTTVPRALAYVEGNLFDDYIHDMKLVQKFAELNRQAMMDEILKAMKLHSEEQFTTIHNYIDTDAMILRKGAVSAEAGEKLLIPINMRDGSLVCIGKGNDDWNRSAPHGAGRLMSRAQAKESFTVSEFKKQMDGIYTTSVSKATLDECPMAYKGMADILENIGPTADVESIIKPVYNFKAGDED